MRCRTLLRALLGLACLPSVAQADPPVAAGAPIPYSLLGKAGGPVALSQITWDSTALALVYAVPSGPRVCITKSLTCPSFLPNASAVVPGNAVSDNKGSYLFDPRTGQFITRN